MTDIELEFGFDLRKEDWSKCSNKACTHGYSKNMNTPRFRDICPTNDLGFSADDKKTSLEAFEFDDLESTIESVEYSL